mmetsp:Transcript_12472/g.40800  ORF Transcript_12472/g.40800 Transcript_12472/m.40800 type:complete len:292 (+) Transcript_12472:263-1138(+)|eukprot:CAMPEP_0118916192 /NCGR_PEP_ID=MMETSP1166-20130328/16249_1 /TAXON_ID=1104430 /ORGANISM="Chrysoreinhardia sp, Strain CCMP3193" /LENGTH=291 /DNA_ID=CAMNT_0006856013 /DNA_START=198 /DNA_END=1073 /DNA_ORIENTATION=-
MAGVDDDATNTKEGKRDHPDHNLFRELYVHFAEVVYGSTLGAGLVADVAYPESPSSKRPVMLSVHGGRWIRGTRHDNGAINVRQWAGMGYFAMAIDYRLVTCSPAPACYEDVLCAIRWVRAHASEYELDLSRFFVVGQSAGGHMAALAATLGQGKFAKAGGWEAESHDFTAAICVSGAYDLVALDWGSGWIPPGEPWDAARFYASPINHISVDGGATRKPLPLLILHSDDDHSVPCEAQAVTFVDALNKQGADVTFLRHQDRGHMLLTPENINAIQHFIKTKFPPGPPGGP